MSSQVVEINSNTGNDRWWWTPWMVRDREQFYFQPWLVPRTQQRPQQHTGEENYFQPWLSEPQQPTSSGFIGVYLVKNTGRKKESTFNSLTDIRLLIDHRTRNTELAALSACCALL